MQDRISALLEQLHKMVTSVKTAAAVQGELAILSELAAYANNASQAKNLCDILVHFLKVDRKMKQGPRNQVLSILNRSASVCTPVE